MYKIVLDKILIFKKVASDVIRWPERCFKTNRKYKGGKKKAGDRRGDVPQGKGQTACMARKKKRAGTGTHAEQRELKPPVFS
ncbi:hypothetical protein DW783_16780 [Phocaeicola vulgatus]|uniref:Uncharacterized protein n=1 Tax=Phocaeicola vulgatus TaxID=821 RepID=A0A414GZZ3_PHOVU|nr:hypothetical protein DW783_16780 [Phocaeicola vulgatus]